MEEQRVAKLLTEYQANIDLWQHDDTTRAQRDGTFLSVNTLLFVALGTLITFRPSVWGVAAIACLVAAFGFPLCIMWYYMLVRGGEYVRFRRFQLRSIEAQLGDVTTITNQWKALDEFQTVSFRDIEDKFTIKSSAKHSVTLVENRIPLVVAVFWFLVFLGGAATAIMHLLGLV